MILSVMAGFRMSIACAETAEVPVVTAVVVVMNALGKRHPGAKIADLAIHECNNNLYKPRRTLSALRCRRPLAAGAKAV